MAPTKKIRVSLDGDGMSAAVEDRAPKIRISEITGIIESSLFESARRAGLSDRLILDLAQIFAWDIDFALEIRAGDRFSVLYAERWLDGKRLGDGPILAAEFANQGKVYQAVRFEDPSGAVNYYSPDGKSMRKAFLRAPVDFRRISSHFQRERWHPVLGKKRPHRGVDYAAATGTPVSASGDGKVVFIGTKSGYGKTIILQHGRKYSTLYAHLNGYRKGLKKGSRVRQGETIGYVGRTGVATGPHLHYEFRVGGVHRNPLTVISPDADPIPKRHLGAFKQASAPLLERLEDMSRTMVAGAR
jgi:murein DD-endopeptidase MepM/ murein hydrolase activator NlpD